MHSGNVISESSNFVLYGVVCEETDVNMSIIKLDSF